MARCPATRRMLLFALERAATAEMSRMDGFRRRGDHRSRWPGRRAPTGVVNEAQGEWLLTRADDAAERQCACGAGQRDGGSACRVPLWFPAAARAAPPAAGPASTRRGLLASAA